MNQSQCTPQKHLLVVSQQQKCSKTKSNFFYLRKQCSSTERIFIFKTSCETFLWTEDSFLFFYLLFHVTINNIKKARQTKKDAKKGKKEKANICTCRQTDKHSKQTAKVTKIESFIEMTMMEINGMKAEKRISKLKAIVESSSR